MKTKGHTLYGLKNNSKVKIKYSLSARKIMEIEGSDCPISKAEISESKMFDMPTFIKLKGIPFFPTKYESFSTGDVSYCSTRIPNFNIELKYDNFLMIHSKTKRYTIKKKEIQIYNRPNRKRKPTQNQVMGMSANDHVQDLIKKGTLINEGNVPVSWHWCHLIGFSMFDSAKAQKKENLICGTAACNGHMTNIETAVKKFACEFNRPLGLEVTATFLAGTHVATRIRYRIFDKKGSMMSHSEYFDPLTTVKTDIGDYESIYERMLKTFEEDNFDGDISTISLPT